MDIKNAFGTDERLETEGFQYYLDDDTWIQLAYAGQSNFKYMAALQRQIEANKGKLKRNKITLEQDRLILIDVYTRTIIKGWGGDWNDEGENIPFSPENAKKLLIKYPSLFTEIVEEAQKIENFRTIRDENETDEIIADAKKS